MSHRVRVTQEAEGQISAISAHIAQDSPVNARRWRASLRERLQLLKDFPDRHEIAYRGELVGKDIRHTFFGTYRILYTIVEKTVVILSVRHGAR
jgi:plasmid stabilization system protein ParE